MADMTMVIGGVAALCAAFVMLVVLRAAPRLTVILWIAVLFFVPIWVGVSLGPFWSAITLMTVAALASCTAGVELTPADGLIAAFVVLLVGQFALGLTSLSATVIALAEWVLPYVWGRLILTRVSAGFLFSVLAAAAGLAAALAVVESVTSTNVFVSIAIGSPSLIEVWAPLQPRGNLVRAEGAFGHSIALGAVLAMSSAFVLASSWRLVLRLLVLVPIAVATLLTLSRIGLVTFVLTLALSLIALPQLTVRARVLIAGAGLVAVIVVVPFVSDVFLDAGQEAAGSADYRLDLWGLAAVIPVFGSAPDIAGLTIDGRYLGVFAKSVDNAPLVAALRVGWVPAALLLAVVAAAVIPLVRRGQANPASVAVAAQVPGLFAVAWITQYAVFFWFAVGLAVSFASASRPSAFDPARMRADTLATRSKGAPAPLIGFEAGSARRAGVADGETT